MPSDTDPEPLPPLLAGRYRLGGLLGSGGMADVWSAEDERLHRPVAVKVLRADPDATTDEDERSRRRFTQEGRTVAALAHPSIVAIHDAGEDGRHAYLVMERLPGGTLRDRLAVGPLADDAARGVLGDVLAALEAAHRAGVVHRDIKPANVLAAADGSWKVADFGIAKAVDVDTGDLTVAGQLVGTPRFTAPERFAGQPATVASDLYSAGVVLREAVAGRTDVDGALLTVIARATTPDPQQRFASARSMADALTAGAGAPTVGLAAAAVVAHPGPPLAAGARTVAGLADEPTAIDVADPTAVLPIDPGRRRSKGFLAGIVVATALALGGGVALAVAGGDGGADEVPTSSTTTTAAPTTATTTTPIATAPATSAVPVTEAPGAPEAEVPAPTSAPAKGKGSGKGKPKGG